MTKDFAKRGAASSSTTKKRRPAPKKTRGASQQNPSSPARSGASGWVWLLTGVALGAFIMFLVYLADIKPEEKPPVAAKSEATKPQAKTETQPRFDFYKLLEETEVPITPPPPINDPAKPKTLYLLQAGSFKSSADADRMRAELILMNLDVTIESVKSDKGELWHRVITGPFDNRSSMAKARSTLISNNIRPLLLKRNPDA